MIFSSVDQQPKKVKLEALRGQTCTSKAGMATTMRTGCLLKWLITA